jgi:predicted transcriptional regulator
MSSYIPKQIKPIRERIEVKFDRELVARLDQYCQYLESERDYVIAQALTVAFRKDKTFAEWQQTHPVPQAGSEAADEANTSKARGQK